MNNLSGKNSVITYSMDLENEFSTFFIISLGNRIELESTKSSSLYFRILTI